MNQEETETSPPQIIDVLSRICMRAKRKPKMLPSDPRAAASYWINHQEPPHEFTEAVRWIDQGDKSHWQTPYHDRLSETLRYFLTLPDMHQVFIIDAIERGIPWRGDNPVFFKSIIDETIKYQADKDAYMAENFDTFRKAGLL